jgi:hypothetical protein
MPAFPYFSSTYFNLEQYMNLSLLVLALVFGVHHGPAWAVFFLLLATGIRFLPMIALLEIVGPAIITAIQKYRRNQHGL